MIKNLLQTLKKQEYSKMSEIKYITNEEKEKLFSMLIAKKLDTSSIPRAHIGVRYGEHKNQRMNIYLPEKPGRYPVIFFLHGGGWQSGSCDDTQVRPFLPGISRDYAVISCEYRLLPEIKYPENLYDVKSALEFLNIHGDEYELDMAKLILAGASAGAHLALMAAFTMGIPAFDGKANRNLPKVRGVIDQFGPADFANEEHYYNISQCPRLNPPGNPAAKALLCSAVDDNPGLYRFLSPIENVHRDIPPVLILHGKYDPMVSSLQSQALCDKITQICGPGRSEIHIDPACTHADTIYEGEPYTAIIFDFIHRCLEN